MARASGGAGCGRARTFCARSHFSIQHGSASMSRQSYVMAHASPSSEHCCQKKLK